MRRLGGWLRHCCGGHRLGVFERSWLRLEGCSPVGGAASRKDRSSSCEGNDRWHSAERGAQSVWPWRVACGAVCVAAVIVGGVACTPPTEVGNTGHPCNPAAELVTDPTGNPAYRIVWQGHAHRATTLTVTLRTQESGRSVRATLLLLNRGATMDDAAFPHSDVLVRKSIGSNTAGDLRLRLRTSTDLRPGRYEVDALLSSISCDAMRGRVVAAESVGTLVVTA